MGKGSSGAKMRIAEYRISLHFGIATALDGIKAIFVGEKKAWSGDARGMTAIQIQQPDLFSGIKEEGGACGLAFYLPGDRQQTMPDGLAARMGLTRSTCPGWRGVSSIMLVGNPYLTIDGALSNSTSNTTEMQGMFSSGGGQIAPSMLDRFLTLYNTILDYTKRGFYMSANNPYLKSVWVTGWRAPKGLSPSMAMIGDDANPAHIIHEILTDREFGMGASLGIINRTSFEVAAQTLKDENFGLSIMWTRQTKIEAFVGEVLDHIQGVVYLDPRTGQLTLKLLRADYTVDTLRVINPSNAILSNFQRKTWGETVNEIVVTYTDPESENDLTTTAQDLANIAMQGGEIVSDSRNYYGVRNGDLAAFLAQRDLAVASTPLVSCDVQLLRDLWDVKVGEVFVLQWPEYGVDQVIVRAGQTDGGTPDSAMISLTLVEDIFSATIAQYSSPPESEHVDTSEDPRPIDFQRVITEPAFMLASRLSDTDLATREYPQVNPLILAAQDSNDNRGFDLYSYSADSTGTLAYRLIGSRTLVSHGTLDGALAAEALSTVISFGTLTDYTPTTGWYVLIGAAGDGEDACELAIVTDVSDDGWHLMRGILDTVPRAWPDGTAIWFIRPDIVIVDPTIRAAGAAVNYKVSPRTSKGALPVTSATAMTPTLTGRPFFPNRPAKVQVCGADFGTADCTGFAAAQVTWANRNRLMETSQILAWSDGNVTPESGQTTTIEVRTNAGALLATHSGLTGTSFDVPFTDFGAYTSAKLRVYAERDGYTSLQYFEIAVIIPTVSTLGLSGTESGALLLSGDMQSGTDKLNIGYA